MRKRSRRGRELLDGGAKLFAGAASSLSLLILGWILYEVLLRGASAISPSFFTELPAPPGSLGGGLGNAILGTLLITSLAAIIGIPLGILAGVFMAEFGSGSRIAFASRFLGKVLMGMPSILIGVFVYTMIVVPSRTFSGYAGAIALAVIIFPIVARTTEEMLRLVPNSIREASMALGAPRWKTTRDVVFRSAAGGVVTGVLLAIARVSGESAPLLFTALNSPYWVESLSEPTANLTVTIFNFAMSPYQGWQAAAWGASLLITASVLVLSIGARVLVRAR